MIAPDHSMRPECAKEFGKIEANLHEHAIFRTEVRTELRGLKEQIESVQTGVAEIHRLLSGHLGEAGGGWERIRDLESSLKRMDDRMWTERLKTGGVVTACVAVLQFAMKLIP
jgi:hypothetical protein